MVDIHTHLLFGVDDGPETLDESIEMIKQAVSIGFTEFILTSHYAKGKYSNKDYHKNYTILKDKVRELEIPVKLHLGNEVYLDENIVETLNSTGYHKILGDHLLVEFSPMTSPIIGKKMLEIVMSMGLTPILAHIERYKNFRGIDFVELHKQGVKFQINISGEKSKGIIKLLKSGYIDYLASDAHGMHRRSYDIGDELKRLKSIKGEKNDEKKGTNGLFSNIFYGIFSKLRVE
ncbi:MAG: tyrosine-protein phosphatase [Cetobacterium sp.]